MSQSRKSIAFYLRKLTPAQINYTTTEWVLLSIVEPLKEFRGIMLGHFITVNIDHNDLTYDNFTIKRVLHWHLLLKADRIYESMRNKSSV